MSLLFVVVLNVSQLTAVSRFLCYCADVYDHLGCGGPADCYSTIIVIVVLRSIRAGCRGPLLLPHVITVYCVYVKSTVPDVYSTGNCDNVVPVFTPVGEREYLSEVLLCWGVDQRSGHDAPSWKVIVTLCISVVIM